MNIPSIDVVKHWVAWGPSADCPDELIDHDSERVEQFEAWLELERATERDRIIAILETEATIYADGLLDPAEVIALIKGEQK